MAPDADAIRQLLRVYDAVPTATSARQAVGMLLGISGKLAKSPADYDLECDPSDAEAWRSAGGESFCENLDFPRRLAERWAEVLARPDFANAGYDKEELGDLKTAMAHWSKALTDWEFDDEGALTARLDELIAAAPEAESDDDDDSEEEESSD